MARMVAPSHDDRGHNITISKEKGRTMDKLQELAVKAQNTKFAMLDAERDERGAAGVEYGLLVALIAAAIIVTVGTLGGQVNKAFQAVSDKIGF
jgi:pilus assembly protein Flp/PilA